MQSGRSTFVVEKELSYCIVGCFYETYNELGFGLNEPLYSRGLEILLVEKGLKVEREYPIVVHFRDQQIGFHRLDMFVERKVVVELKATEVLAEHARRQLRTYVKLADVDLGILLHFGPKPRFYRELGANHGSMLSKYSNTSNSSHDSAVPAVRGSGERS